MADSFLPPAGGAPAAHAHDDVDMDDLPDARPALHPNAVQEASDDDDDDDEHAPDSPANGGDHAVHADGDDADRYQVSEESQRARERKEQLVQQLLMKRRATALAVPTNDSAVRQRLRHLGHPITLFGEREMERRDRLRAIMAKLDADGDLEKLVQAHEASADAHADEAHPEAVHDDVPPMQLFYTEGSPELLQCRKMLLRYSLPRANARIERAKRKRTDPDEDEDAETDQVLKSMAETTLDCSEIGDGRPLSSCAFSPDASMLATA
jgi:U4/U6 small nuclear ribonucleoprotein PRP4